MRPADRVQPRGAGQQPDRGGQQDQRAGREPGDDDRQHRDEQQGEPGPGHGGGPARSQSPDPRLRGAQAGVVDAELAERPATGHAATRGTQSARNSPATPRMISPVRSGQRAQPQPDPAQHRAERPPRRRPTGANATRTPSIVPAASAGRMPGDPARARANAAGDEPGRGRGRAGARPGSRSDRRPSPRRRRAARVRQRHRASGDGPRPSAPGSRSSSGTPAGRPTRTPVAARRRPNPAAACWPPRAAAGRRASAGRCRTARGASWPGSHRAGPSPRGRAAAHRRATVPDPRSWPGSRTNAASSQDARDRQRAPEARGGGHQVRGGSAREPEHPASRECDRAAPRPARTWSGRVRSPTGGRRRLRRARGCAEDDPGSVPGPGELGGRLLRLPGQQQGDDADGRRQPRAHIAPRQRRRGRLGQLEVQLPGSRRRRTRGRRQAPAGLGRHAAVAGLAVGRRPPRGRT